MAQMSHGRRVWQVRRVPAPRGCRARRRRGAATRNVVRRRRCRRASSSRTSAACVSAWSWALRRIRSTWASASLSSSTRFCCIAHQPRRAGQADQRDVEVQVPLVELLVGRAGLRPRRCRRRAWPHLGRAAPRWPRPAADPGALEHQPGAADVVHRARPPGVDDRDAAVGLAGGQALGDQHGQRLADGRPGDAQRRGQGDLAQRRAGLELAVEDRPAQLVGDPVDGRGVLEVQRAERLGASDMRPVLVRYTPAQSRGPPQVRPPCDSSCHTVRLSDCLTIMHLCTEGLMDTAAQPLSWGRHYVMVEPTHFRVDYAINPFMDPADQPDPALAMAQWRPLVVDHRAPRRPRRRRRRSAPTPPTWSTR